MTPTRRTFFLRLAAAGAALAASTAFAAWPERPITIVVPTAPGGANDAMARIVGQFISARLKQPVIVDNKAGANGAIASEFVAKAAPDGYTLMLGYIATHAMNPALQKLRYDPVKDFEPIGQVGTSPVLLVVNPTVKANNAKELVAELKAQPTKYSYASAGNGTAPHFAGELFKQAAGLPSLLHVAYKGSAPAVTDTIAGQTQLMFPSLFTAVPYVKGGKLKAIGVAGSKRSPLLPDVPTLAEQGINVDVSQWYAIFAPARTPRPVVDELNAALNAALADKEVIPKLQDHGLEVASSTPDALRTLVQQDLAKWRKVVQAGNLKAD